MRAARAACSFFLTRPIKVLICGVVVVVAIVDVLKLPKVQRLTCSIHARNHDDSMQESNGFEKSIPKAKA